MSTALYAAMSAGPKTKRSRYELLRNALLSERQGGGYDSHWRDLSDFIMPRRTRFWAGERNRGEKRSQNIIDSTGRFAARTLASGLHAGLTSPARPWMRLTTPDPDLVEFGPVKEWLHIVTQRMLTVFLQSNLYNILPTVYLDMGVFGTAAMAQLGDSRDLFRAWAYPVGSYAVSMDERGVVNTFYREYELTVRQAVRQFGVRPGRTEIDWTPFSSRIKTAFDRGDYEQPVTIGWLVQPNENQDRSRLDAKDRMPFTSHHFEIEDQSQGGGPQGNMDDRFLRESGFPIFPLFVPRWETTGEDAYGTDCPGMTVLGDVRQLQIMQRRKGQLLSKAVDPPLKGPSGLRTQKTSLVAGDITYVDVREGQQGLAPIHEIRLEGFQHITADMAEVQERINEGFYKNLFLMLAMSEQRQPVTAREIEERHEEKLLALGPVLERTNDELLDPMIDRTYAMMDAAGLIPEPPEDLDGVELKVEYLSIMAQAQKLVGVVGQDRFVASTVPLIEAFPEVRHKIKVFQIVDSYADILGVDPRIVRDDDEAQQLADQEGEQAAQVAQAAQMKDMAGAVAAAGAKPIAPNSPLDQMLSGAAAAQAGV